MFNLNHLTLGDIDVIKAIKANVKEEESVINVREICKHTRVSRPMFTIVLKTLCFCNIVDSRSLGAKGTWIKIKDKSFFDQF